MIRAAVVALVCASGLLAQQRVPPELMYHRIWAVLPLVGTGTAADPIRPMFMPKPADAKQGRSGILAMHVELSDDGKTALVELVAADREAFTDILHSKLPEVKVFERGKDTQADVEQEFKKHKKNFAFNALTAARPQ